MAGYGPDYEGTYKALRAVAQRTRLKHSYLEDGEPVFKGKRGIIALDGDTWTWVLVPGLGQKASWTKRTVESARKDPRLQLITEADGEAIFAIPNPDDLVDVAIKWAQCYRKRSASTADHLRSFRMARLQDAPTDLQRTEVTQ